MLSDNIKKYRKAQNMSQEDLAVKVHVVRQTISKWENSLSVPDVDQLISLAKVLGVSVNDLLGAETENLDDRNDIVAELVKANEQIARYAEEERLRKSQGKIRGLMIWLTIIAVVSMQINRNEIVAMVSSSILFVTVLVVLYRNISLLSAGYSSAGSTRRIKAATIFDIALVILVTLFGILVKAGKIHVTVEQETIFASALVSVIIIVIGIIAPKLPYNRHTGLRLPWTVQNEGAWNIAHKVLGIISIPLGLIYMSLSFFVSNHEALTLIVVAIWVGVPGAISLLFAYSLTKK